MSFMWRIVRPMHKSARVIARVVACFVVLQAYFIAGPYLAERSAGEVGWDAALGQLCAAPRDDERSPRSSHQHDKCPSCVASRCVSLIPGATVFVTGRRIGSTSDWAPTRPSDDRVRPPIGWASSWSSRSPPSFS
jgi:hypothetical protein